MEKILPGSSELQVSRIAFGCMSLGDDHRHNSTLLKKAFDGGINFFDTADLYQKGENEVSVGKAFKEMRKEVVIATKVGNQWKEDGSGWVWNPNKDYILQAVEKSLKRLQTDYIDLYLLHGGTLEDPAEETLEAFELLKQEGKILQYGISSIRPNVVRRYTDMAQLTAVMTQYSLLDRRPEENILPVLEKKGIVVLARGALAKGLLATKPASGYLQYDASQIQKLQNGLEALSGPDRPVAITSLLWLLARKSVIPVIGIRTEDHLNTAIQALDYSPLSKEEIEELDTLFLPQIYQEHR
ncbi:MAG: aldo/keto reductase [Cyclobacteriaceae bacterium]|nr:aldo/keto reductase [Cyclobacteriaceae bacterium]